VNYLAIWLGSEQWCHTELGAPCKKVVRSFMVNFISSMEATTLVRKKRGEIPQIGQYVSLFLSKNHDFKTKDHTF
jgi:hypothetical protein